MKRCIQSVVCTFIFLGLVVTAGAYVLPAKQVLDFMVEQFGSNQTLVVFQKTVVYDPDIEGGMEELDETLYYMYPDRFRSEVSGPELEKIQVLNEEGALVVIDGKIFGETESLFDHFKDLLLYSRIDLLVDKVFQLGVNVDIVSLGRFRDKIVYVVGAKYPDESVSQVWIDKKNFRPVRFILNGGKETPIREIEYSEYRELDKTKVYPGRISFYEDGNLVRMYVLERFEINPEISDQMFDVGYLKGIYEPLCLTLSLMRCEEALRSLRKSLNRNTTILLIDSQKV